MTRILVTVADENCLAAMTAYIDACRSAGIDFQLQEAQLGFALEDERSYWISWGPDEDTTTEHPHIEDEWGEAEDEAEDACLVPCVASLYLRTIMFLARRPGPHPVLSPAAAGGIQVG